MSKRSAIGSAGFCGAAGCCGGTTTCPAAGACIIIACIGLTGAAIPGTMFAYPGALGPCMTSTGWLGAITCCTGGYTIYCWTCVTICSGTDLWYSFYTICTCARGGGGIAPRRPAALGSVTAIEYSNALCCISALECLRRDCRICLDASRAASHFV